MRTLPLVVALCLCPALPMAAQELATSGAGEVGFVDGAPPSPSAAERLAEIRRRIQSVLRYPPAARLQRLEGETLVRFGIEADGAPGAVTLHRSSGRPTLDRAAIRAVRDAAPLPWIYGRLEVPVRFELDARR